MDRLLSGDGAAAPPPRAARPSPAGDGGQALFRLDLLRSLKLHRRLALGIALAGVVLAVAYWFYAGPVYDAQSIVYIQPAPPRVMAQGPSWPYAQRWPYDSNTYESYIQQQMQNVTRTDVLNGALHKLGAGVWQQSGESDQAAVERMRQSIKVTREGTSYQFTIGAHASDPAAAAALANAVAASFIESASHEQKAGDTQRLAVLGEERDRVQKALAADRTEQEALNKQLGVAAIGTATPDVYDEDIGRIRGQLITARTAHDEAAARLTSMNASEGASSAALDAEADTLVATDAGLMSMKTSLNQRRAILISQMANLTPSHPQYKQDAAELAQINGNLDSMMTDLRTKAAARIQQRLRTDLERTAGVEARLNGQLGQLAGAAGGATAKLQRSNDLAIDINRLQNRFTTVDEEWRNLMLEEGAPGSAFVSAAATPAMHQAMFGVLRKAALLVLAGLFFGILAAVTAHKLDPRVYIAADVERVLGFAPMAQLPDFVEVSDAVAEEHMLRLAAAIEYARKQGNLKSCIFTGTGPGTGVTTVATRVRDLLEAMGRKTVLVDASGTPSSAARASSAGSGQPGAQALVAAHRGNRPTALLHQMVEEESQAQGESLVLTDTAPLAVSAETEYLARFVDCAIVVVESGVTTRTQLRESAAALQRLDVAAVGFVLNRIGLEKADPSFRLSVQAIETHLHSQSSSVARRTVRSRPVEADAAPAKLAQHEPAVPAPVPVTVARLTSPAVPAPVAVAVAAAPRPSPAIPESAVKAVVHLSSPAVPASVAVAAAPRPPAAVPESAVKAVARLSSPAVTKTAAVAAAPRPSTAVADRLAKPAKPAHARPREPRTTQAQESIQPMTNQNSDLPWWLADLFSQAEEPRPASPPEPAKASWPQPVAADFKPMAAAAKPHPAPPPVQSWKPVVQSWEGVPSEYDKAKPVIPKSATADSPMGWKHAAGPEDVREPEPEDSTSSLATRLSGLRSLLSVLGVKGQHEIEEPATKAPEAVRQLEPVIDRPTVARTIMMAPAAATLGANSAVSASPKLVIAAPEFLPPKPVEEEKENSRASRFKNRRDRLDDDDDLQILPSWRGQYKKT
jgi:uncharacterized protein involved in exopolysaccharide biosynthesis